MSASAGVPGYETLSSARQQRLTTVRQALARDPSFPPVHLSRTLYIPRHGSFDFEVSVADVSSEYAHAISHAPLGGGEVIGPAPMGGILFMTRLNAMAKSAADNRDAKPRYAVRAAADADKNISITVQRSPPGRGDVSATVSLPSAAAGFAVDAQRDMNVVASFPLPDTACTCCTGTAQHPFFTFRPDGDDKLLQWRINLLQDGPLRYTLVEIDDGAASSDHESYVSKPETTRAIYHSVGPATSLTMGCSEGVLLLPQDNVSGGGSATELVILASLLGLLWRVRALQGSPPVDAPSHKGGKTFIQRILRK